MSAVHFLDISTNLYMSEIVFSFIRKHNLQMFTAFGNNYLPSGLSHSTVMLCFSKIIIAKKLHSCKFTFYDEIKY